MAKQDKTEQLIEALSQVATPVKPITSSRVYTFIWFISTLALISIVIYVHGMRHDIIEKFSESIFLVKTLMITGLGTLLAYAGFKLGIPDSPQKHRIWVAAIYGALVFWLSLVLYDALYLGFESITHELGHWHIGYAGCICAMLIVSSSLGAATVMFIMLRKTFPLRPLLASLGVGTAAGSLAYASSMYFCSIESTTHIFTWHMLPMLIIAIIISIIGHHLLRQK